jgi:hypothetical protein
LPDYDTIDTKAQIYLKAAHKARRTIHIEKGRIDAEFFNVELVFMLITGVVLIMVIDGLLHKFV